MSRPGTSPGTHGSPTGTPGTPGTPGVRPGTSPAGPAPTARRAAARRRPLALLLGAALLTAFTVAPAAAAAAPAPAPVADPAALVDPFVGTGSGGAVVGQVDTFPEPTPPSACSSGARTPPPARTEAVTPTRTPPSPDSA
ncbi:hypothetical protein GXW82_17235 [Streptacidiphilus sp. 4-A2]|nr:hypothetical protein [Streptacidiphilus sp. 4-A2]